MKIMRRVPVKVVEDFTSRISEKKNSEENVNEAKKAGATESQGLNQIPPIGMIRAICWSNQPPTEILNAVSAVR